ncbi:type IV pilin protein [Chromobacterium sp. Beijing]|uniref:type IV pilin protein n=1 Tax=Chromobacterium sp. Beijing TaxID=2735795 RepID=UPI0027150513|nr:type IV pilin protein [Chromobacterium sp. Beijing]UJB32591.1 type IV pilin protein [Chromobacterium sp. Beijing]
MGYRSKAAKRVNRGFTLIELIIVVAIVGILVSIALPSYTNYVQRTYRAEVQTELQAIAQAQEKYFTLNNAYASSLTALSYASSSISSQDNRYTITMGDLSASATLANGQGYTLQAAPAGGQVGESCGTLSLNSLGSKSAASGTVSNCWR